MSFSSILLCSLMAFVSVILRIIHKSWLAPSAFYSLWWTSTTFLSIIIGYEENISLVGLFWLLISSILIGLGSLFFVFKEVNHEKRLNINDSFIYHKNRYLKKIYSFSLIISFLYIVSNLYYNQTSIEDFKSLEGIFLIAAKFTIDRYEENITLPIYIKIQLSFVFFSNSIGGILYGLTKQLRFLICLIPPVIISLVFTEKAGIFFCSAAWISSYFIVWIMFGKNRIFNFQTFSRILIFGFIVVVILTASSFARLGTVELSELSIVKDKLSSYFGHVPAFSNWLSTYNYSDLSMEFGKYTLSGILDFLGLSKREIGLYDINYQLSNGTLTNIYSIHKGLILDYSVVGSVIIYILFGFISSFFYISVRKKNSKWVAYLSISYFLIIGSIFTSILVYNTIFLSCVMTIAAFSLIKFEKV